ncbi:alpha-2-macroglobulin [Elysia marginata]|uniref:Alpha-2-macroglobulin n=1 Tax=Elysia marginata TaxID=1093978 RepID=A0AAV4J5V6_9GAST|nr:alpha-2-macroglobulin [Elysia marginata]
MHIGVSDNHDNNPIPAIHDIFYMAVDKRSTLLQGGTALNIDTLKSAINYPNADDWSGTMPIVTNTAKRSQFRYLARSILQTVIYDEPSFAESKPQVRKDFPDTWLWGHAKSDPSGKFVQTVTLPDSITSWEVSAFAVSEKGISVAPAPTLLTAFRNFFLSLNLPYSVKRSEVFQLRVTVFNYNTGKITVSIEEQYDASNRVQYKMSIESSTFKHEHACLKWTNTHLQWTRQQPMALLADDSRFIRARRHNGTTVACKFIAYCKKGVSQAIVAIHESAEFVVLGGINKDGWYETTTTINGGSASTVQFRIGAVKAGYLKLKAKATDLTSGDYDEVHRDLLVQHDGVERISTINKIMSTRQEEKEVSETFKISWPREGISSGSKRIEVKVTGEIFGQALPNLNQLVIMPTGCGEQTMIKMAPNIFGLFYIQARKLEGLDKLMEGMTINMQTGYARQISNFRHLDGSYSVWGPEKSHVGSTW